MGNKLNTNVTSGIKDQAAGGGYIYQFTDMKGGGKFIELMKKANRTKNYKELDDAIRDGLKDILYNEGEGKMIHIKEIVKVRAADKGIILSDKKGNNDSLADPENSTYDPEYIKKHGPQFKEVCCRLDARGAVGETPLHVCLLNATSLHADLAKRLLRNYPKLINDIYISDMYYGESCLHMAIVNEDPAVVKFLLDNGVDYHERACGNFFTTEDQKNSCKDSLEHEWFDLPVNTNYEGPVYFGEYPLSFAACLGQEECVRLLVAKGANPNLQDSNGNTTLHMLVIHDKKDMFDLVVSLGGDLSIKNRQGLTPLTLAAKLARKDLYDHILEIEREVYWIYGNVTCAAYPLEHIDTIDANGEINLNSAVYHVVYGDDSGHLDMIDGVISQLLHEKWKTFVKSRFRRRFIFFLLYFVIFFAAMYIRPGTDRFPTYREENKTETVNGNETIEYPDNITVVNPCYLLRADTTDEKARLVLEALTLIGSIIYIFLSLKEIYHQGYRIFFQTLSSSPTKALFLLSNIFVILMVPGRAACAYTYEDIMAVMAILCTAPYFLFFCRGLKIVGPFVVMIYKMIRTDLLRFFTIYLIFVIGFSQSMFVIFRGYDTTIFNQPVEGMMGMFIMSLGEFADIFDSFTYTRYPTLPKVIFAVYMILVTLLLVNMLIAMMGNTYQMVNETQKEWLRQWAKIILVVEQTVTTGERKKQQINYSQPLKDKRRALVIRWHQTEKEQEEIRKTREMSRIRQRLLLQKKHEMRIQKTGNMDVINVKSVQQGTTNV